MRINRQLQCFVLTQDNRQQHLISRDTRHSKMYNNLEIQQTWRWIIILCSHAEFLHVVFGIVMSQKHAANSSWKLPGIFIFLLSIPVLVYIYSNLILIVAKPRSAGSTLESPMLVSHLIRPFSQLGVHQDCVSLRRDFSTKQNGKFELKKKK